MLKKEQWTRDTPPPPPPKQVGRPTETEQHTGDEPTVDPRALTPKWRDLEKLALGTVNWDTHKRPKGTGGPKHAMVWEEQIHDFQITSIRSFVLGRQLGDDEPWQRFICPVQPTSAIDNPSMDLESPGQCEALKCLTNRP